MERSRRNRGRPLGRGHHRGEEAGAALVEFALIVTLFLMLVFGMIEFGVDFNNYIALRNGSREAARMGVVNDLSNAPSCKINGVTVTPPAKPTSQTDATNALICKAKSRIGLAGSQTKISVTVPNPTIGGTLQLCADYPVSSITGLVAPFVSGKTMVSNVTMRLEQVPLVRTFSETNATC
jgi:Flp pilus assembly protein TadG